MTGSGMLRRSKASTRGNIAWLTAEHDTFPATGGEEDADSSALRYATFADCVLDVRHALPAEGATSVCAPGLAINDDGEPYPPGLEPATLGSVKMRASASTRAHVMHH